MLCTTRLDDGTAVNLVNQGVLLCQMQAIPEKPVIV